MSVPKQNSFYSEEITLMEALDNSFRLHPDKIFISHLENHYSYSTVYRKVNGFAEFLSNKGVVKGDIIGLALQKIPEMIIAFLGAVKIGALPAPINYTLNSSDYNAFIERVQAKVLVVSADLIPPLANRIIDDPSLTKVIVNGAHPDFINWQDTCPESDWQSPLTPAMTDIAYLNYTTGSTGLPKGAVATHRNLYWNTLASVEAMKINDADVHLCLFASFAHPHELFARAMYTGGSIVLLEQINPKTIVKTINTHKVTCMMGLAPMYEMMITHCSDQQLASLRIAESGGMYTRPDVATNFHKSFGIPILSAWGSTETSGIALANTRDQYKMDGSMGKPCPHYEVKIVDEEGVELGPGEVGELIFKGDGVIDSYGPEAPLAKIDGWYYSGDFARKDPDGFFYFVERKSGLIKVAGLKVYPLQIELKLREHPGIKEIAVIGVKERRHGMVPKAFVVAEDGVTLDIEEIILFCKDVLANYMIPKSFELVKALPKIGSGKIDKKALAILAGQ